MTEHHEPGDRVTDGPLLDLHDQIVAAIERRESVVAPAATSRSGARIVSFVGAAAAVVALVVGIVVVSVTGGRSDVGADATIHRDGSSVTVSIENDVDVDKVNKALLDAGVDVKVVPTPTGPSRINRFVGISGPPSSKLVGGDGTSSNKATFIAGSRVELLLGVAANGRMYDATTSAWEHHEPLEGRSLEGKALSVVGAELESRAAATGTALDYRLDVDGQPSPPEPGDILMDAQATSADTVIVMLHR